jgi:uncharacterized membrane protein YdjX (TVP38/TMEM64 family)
MALIALAVVCVVFLGGLLFLDVSPARLAATLGDLREDWWAPAAVTFVFVLLAFVGAPQLALIAATVAVFGAGEGAVLSWTATMISAGVGFYLGRAMGAAAVRDISPGPMKRVIDFAARNGFWTACLIRLAPAAPFVLVNMALGAVDMTSPRFFVGTGIGILPKIVLVAVAGVSVGGIFTQLNPAALAFFATAVAVWILGLIVLRGVANRKAPASEE